MLTDIPSHRLASVGAVQQDLLGVVLAGGKSSRMGRDKATLIHPCGLTFLEHAIARLSQVTSHVAVSGRPLAPGNVFSIPDQIASQGPAMAVWSAVLFASQANHAAVLLTPVDMPDLEPQHLQLLIDLAMPDRPTCATFDGQTPHPLVALYPVALASELAEVARSQRRSLRAYLTGRPVQCVMLPESVNRDCNTPHRLDR